MQITWGVGWRGGVLAAARLNGTTHAVLGPTREACIAGLEDWFLEFPR
jgi:hypothetical protein